MIKINGETCDLNGGISVRELLTARNFLFPLLIVKINGEFVSREQYEQKIVPEGSAVEVIHLISGG